MLTIEIEPHCNTRKADKFRWWIVQHGTLRTSHDGNEIYSISRETMNEAGPEELKSILARPIALGVEEYRFIFPKFQIKDSEIDVIVRHLQDQIDTWESILASENPAIDADARRGYKRWISEAHDRIICFQSMLQLEEKP